MDPLKLQFVIPESGMVDFLILHFRLFSAFISVAYYVNLQSINFKVDKKTVVAIFEDDLVNRFIYNRIFRSKKALLDVHIFDRPETGFEVASRVSFDVVFIEAHFWEDFGGIKILQRMKENANPDTIFIA